MLLRPGTVLAVAELYSKGRGKTALASSSLPAAGASAPSLEAASRFHADLGPLWQDVHASWGVSFLLYPISLHPAVIFHRYILGCQLVPCKFLGVMFTESKVKRIFGWPGREGDWGLGSGIWGWRPCFLRWGLLKVRQGLREGEGASSPKGSVGPRGSVRLPLSA